VVISLPIEQHTLRNGIRVVFQPDQSSPAVAVSVAYRAGSSFESDGQFGFSNAIFQMLRTTHPSTASHSNPDYLQFTSVGPPSALPILLWREADRISRPVDAPAFSALQASADVQLFPSDRAELLAYQGCSAYGHTSFGWTDDLRVATPGLLNSFRGQYLNPSHIVIVIAGPIDSGAALAQVRRLFEHAPSLPPVHPPAIDLPDQTNQRVDVDKTSSLVPQMFLYGWAVAPASHEDYSALRLLVDMIADKSAGAAVSRSSRFALLPSDASLTVRLDPRLGPSWLTLRVEFPSTLDMDRTRKVIDDALLDLARRGPTAEEMMQAWRGSTIGYLGQLSRVDYRASELARVVAMGLDPSDVFRITSELVDVNRGDIQRVARQYLTPIRRNLVELRGPRVVAPKPAPSPAASSPVSSSNPPQAGAPKKKGPKSSNKPQPPPKNQPKKPAVNAPSPQPSTQPAPKPKR